jgi:hypothetical protein
MKPCKFTFDDTPAFDGFAYGSTWNGFDNVAVTPEVRDQIVAYFKKEYGGAIPRSVWRQRGAMPRGRGWVRFSWLGLRDADCGGREVVTSDEFRETIERLGLSQIAAARLLGVDARTSRRWASGAPVVLNYRPADRGGQSSVVFRSES